MTDQLQAGPWLAPGEPVDLSNCEREPIHVPGSIQPRGVLLAVSEPDMVVRQVSRNLADVVGTAWDDALGRPLADVIGVGPAGAIARSASAFGDLRERNPVELVLDCAGTPCPVDAILHRAIHSPDGSTLPSPAAASSVDGQVVTSSASTLVVELEPAYGPRPFSFPNTYQAVRGTIADLNRAGSLQELYDITAEAVRALTGFDRVMVYRYDADYNGEVVAEAKLPELNSFLGLHYPASDVPAQARALYEKNWVRLISDVAYTPSPLEPVDLPSTGRPLDLTYSTLRSVSPIHCEYLQNMGVRSSMSISLLRGEKLWGLIACHHYTGPHAPPYATRAAAEFLGSTLSLRLVDRTEDEEHRRALRVRSTMAWLTTAALDEDRPLSETVLGRPGLLDVVPASSVVVSLQGHTGGAGVPLPPEVAGALARWAGQQSGDVVSTDRLPLVAPQLDVPAELACGVLALPLPEGQYVIWTRSEQVHSVDWGGDPHNKAIAEREGDSIRLSPRKSFDRWRETVRDRSEAWSPAELAEAGELRNNLLEALYARSRRVARTALTLQRSLLSAPPERDDLDFAVRYVPAAREAQVGGDWYDVFQQPDGATMLVIGDVVGHDTEAAACMGQLRGLLRGISYDSDDSPAGVLQRLDRAMAGLELKTMASVLVARLEQTAEERRRGVTRLRWANAGHLPPVVAGPDGQVEVLDGARADLLLGVDATAARRDHVLTIPRGSTVLLYTDGLVERRDQLFDIGVERLREEFGRVWQEPVDELADQLLARMLPDRAEDDVALVTVRLKPQDQPA
ncbi:MULTISPECIES: SpoIIE family protein phosphatase [unclassified Modestobacter]|uniref:SpoIIE family protein phosphatase n=1 Tax=unclassified Modestobacter TaxID=2643866 RepID=UPI0022AA8508|nr:MULTISPECIES: SpoIIE family protein phosphatase [unclassified Modestobacter]MCZ2824415.1 SpoIIE family protein phosphatase [Modestobacter sp. VKM Ac-2981]MCZ2854057.1 SpoIIE family protein phosphatase [Modestobacter sp. VKM Ac-2982]